MKIKDPGILEIVNLLGWTAMIVSLIAFSITVAGESDYYMVLIGRVALVAGFVCVGIHFLARPLPWVRIMLLLIFGIVNAVLFFR